VLLSSGNDHYYTMKLRRNRLDVKILNLKVSYKIIYDLKLRTYRSIVPKLFRQ